MKIHSSKKKKKKKDIKVEWDVENDTFSYKFGENLSNKLFNLEEIKIEVF